MPTPLRCHGLRRAWFGGGFEPFLLCVGLARHSGADPKTRACCLVSVPLAASGCGTFCGDDSVWRTSTVPPRTQAHWSRAVFFDFGEATKHVFSVIRVCPSLCAPNNTTHNVPREQNHTNMLPLSSQNGSEPLLLAHSCIVALIATPLLLQYSTPPCSARTLFRSQTSCH